MTQDTINLQEFLSNAVAVLDETKANLEHLARIALLRSEEASADPENGQYTTDESALHLQQIGQELMELSERSEALHSCLQNGLDTPPPQGNHWSRVRILQSQEEERAKLAHELEDSVGQLLANAVFELASCRHLLSGGQDVGDGLEALQTELEQGLTDIRHFITNLEPASVLGSFGLGGGIRRYLEQFEARTGLKTQLRMHTNIGRLPSFIEIAIFRIIQETLSNVFNHANATQVDVTIEEKDDALKFTVIDNGDGLISEKVSASRKNLGLARVVDYVELLNGDLRVLSELGRGTQVILSVPHSSLST
jgi:signal transduction histidine kinase